MFLWKKLRYCDLAPFFEDGAKMTIYSDTSPIKKDSIGHHWCFFELSKQHLDGKSTYPILVHIFDCKCRVWDSNLKRALILTTDLKLAFFGLSKQLLDGNAHFSNGIGSQLILIPKICIKYRKKRLTAIEDLSKPLSTSTLWKGIEFKLFKHTAVFSKFLAF